MRFLIGLVSGAAVMLLLAQGLRAVDSDWLERAPAWFDELAAAAGDALALPPRPPEASAPPDLAAARSAPARQSSPAPAADSAGGAAPDPASVPIPRPPDPRLPDTRSPHGDALGDPDPPAAVDAAGPVAQRDAGSGVSEVVDRDVPQQHLFDETVPDEDVAHEDVAAIVERVFGRTAADAAEVAAASQSVWVPFHSRMSASGFAERLTESLHHPFQVERRGPGRYQVVFRYQDEPQRQALLAQAAQVTGLPL